MTFDPRKRPAIVTNEDRQWAMEQRPAWCRPGYPEDGGDAGEIVDTGAALDVDEAGEAIEVASIAAILPRAYPRLVDEDGNVHFPNGSRAPAARHEAPYWGLFVDEQVEAFERHFAGKLDTPAAWSKLFRGKWWADADAERRFPNSKPLNVPPGGYVFLRPGSALHRAALGLAPNPTVRRLWVSHGVQLEARDPLLTEIRTAAAQRHAA